MFPSRDIYRKERVFLLAVYQAKLNPLENVTLCDFARSGQADGAREQSQPLGFACWVMSPGCCDLGSGVGGTRCCPG